MDNHRYMNIAKCDLHSYDKFHIHVIHLLCKCPYSLAVVRWDLREYVQIRPLCALRHGWHEYSKSNVDDLVIPLFPVNGLFFFMENRNRKFHDFPMKIMGLKAVNFPFNQSWMILGVVGWPIGVAPFLWDSLRRYHLRRQWEGFQKACDISLFGEENRCPFQFSSTFLSQMHHVDCTRRPL
jgi:hypothetical protein